MTSLSSSSSSGTEYIVRVPKNTTKKYNIMAFNAGDKVACSTWTQARMERDMSARRIYGEEEAAEGAAGSEFGKKQREEARRKKFGIVTKEFKVEDQPWILKVNGKAGKRFKGIKKGGVTENASYYIFTQCVDGAFEAFPVHGWYNFMPVAKHRTLTAEEAEEEWGRRNKVVNHFSIMLQRRLREQERGEDEEDEAEKGGKKKKKGGGRGGDLRIHDLEDDLEMSSDDSHSSGGEDGESKSKPKKDAGKGKGKKKKRKGNEHEALEDSDDGDYEGLEVDYMSDESSSEEEPEKGKPVKAEEHPKGIDEMSESEEESEEEKQNEEETKEEEEEDDGKKTPVQPEKKKKKADSSGESESSDDSDIEGETASALFMKKRTPPKRAGGRGSAGSSRTGSRPGTPSIDSGSTSSTLRAAASKLEQGKRQSGSATDTPAAKRLKMEPNSQSPAPSGKSTPQPASGKSTPSSSDVQLTEEAVRRYLIRKPMTTKDLLKKFQTKRTGLSNEQTVNVLAQILKRLNPERKNVNDKMHFYLTE
ncbi:general transcription factor IIF subunit 1 isoform X1 [Boleophthalmus pectinirostris]|uniref:general transcription factor IIF subunit 1 isoform X1 n=1 Tax=Boleophthalmus pectinirostris TaxID=150288 RepID=UPI000A1C25EA|nr:general transcription factor IIF subunit 1 isoform X1 [Boleophthalmus pectinirostris]XP_055008929.1 general transcription factor IIF subunit 1 isoform X1 [Boleophthalmus pectinirostris]XP_055008930.1 general transcription factor IIF subunit 1 isoform X1 [Boleophthalmus pectinirostris]